MKKYYVYLCLLMKKEILNNSSTVTFSTNNKNFKILFSFDTSLSTAITVAPFTRMSL